MKHLEGSKKRVSTLLAMPRTAESKSRFSDELWEAYTAVETAIAMSKTVFGGYKTLGVMKKIRTSKKSNPLSMTSEEFSAVMSLISSELGIAQTCFSELRSDPGLEHARKARDELKRLLLSLESS